MTTPTKGLVRSSSEIYIKKTDMQEEEDAFFVPIMYAAEASMTTNRPNVWSKLKAYFVVLTPQGLN